MAEGAASWEKLKIKSEDNAWSEENHSHTFILKLLNSKDEFTIHCDHLQTVLEAIKSKVDLKQKLQCDDQSLTVQITAAHMGTAIATHFPCSRLCHHELITLARTNEQVEERGEFDRTVFHNERCYIVFIRTTGGLNAKTKALFKSSAIKKFEQLCVYGTKDMTIRDAIARDGRFKELGLFKLQDVSKDKSYVFSDDKISAHENKTFRICFEKMTKRTEDTKPERQTPVQRAGETSQAQGPVQPKETTQVLPMVLLSEDLKRKGGRSEDLTEIIQLLKKQFPELKKKMLERFPGKTFQEKLKKVDFGKTQQSFSDVLRLEKLLTFGTSICKLVVGEALEGTAFVLFHPYILTNAHLFKGAVRDNILDSKVKVTALFHYKNPNQENTFRFAAHNLIDFDPAQDYAVLELLVTDQTKVLPGLMKLFSPMPESGEACIMGHPAGDVLKIDPTCVIEKPTRREVVEEHLQQFKDDMFTHMSVSHLIEQQGISRILSESDPLSPSVTSYHTFMYHGSSGSPVFDAQCGVFGLHSGGFVYGLRPEINSVIEFSHPTLLIFEKFVTNLKTRNQEKLLRLVKENSELNLHLKAILEKVLVPEEPMDTN